MRIVLAELVQANVFNKTEMPMRIFECVSEYVSHVHLSLIESFFSRWIAIRVQAAVENSPI